MTTQRPPSKPRHLSEGLGFAFVLLTLVGCARRGITYEELINIVAQNECPRSELGATPMMVVFWTPDTLRYVAYPPANADQLDSNTLFQLGTLTTSFLVPQLLDGLAARGLSLDSTALVAGRSTGSPWEITFKDLLLHHSGITVYNDNSTTVDDQLSQKLERIDRQPDPGTERPFAFDHWNYTLARMAIASRTRESEVPEFRSANLSYVDRADSSVRRKLAPSEATAPAVAPKQATELFVASTGGMASAERMANYVRAWESPELDRLAAASTTDARPGTEITLGWYRNRLKNGEYVYTNAGRTRKHGSAVAFYPATQTGVVVLASDSKSVDCLALDLLRNLNDNWKSQPVP